ncbi:hypothetical protein J4457_02435 [Candidatus Woesearchaeota archaeon]|nr:hypothetical protein [Candidatus Woesearchaeota archaeon]
MGVIVEKRDQRLMIGGLVILVIVLLFILMPKREDFVGEATRAAQNTECGVFSVAPNGQTFEIPSELQGGFWVLTISEMKKTTPMIVSNIARTGGAVQQVYRTEKSLIVIVKAQDGAQMRIDCGQAAKTMMDYTVSFV